MRFTEKHADKIQGTISTFDRMIFRGYLHGFFTEKGMPYYMRQHNVLLKQYGDFVQKQTGELKSHIEALAASSDVSVIYLNSPQVSKESIAKEQLALQDNREGLVTVIKSVELCGKLESKKWDRFFDVLADKANPLLPGIKQVFGKGYEWYLHQCEYATDVLFNNRETLQQLYPSLVEHTSLYTGGEDILTFFGRKAHLNWQGEVIGDRKRFAQGFRVKHRIDGNAIKMYDKSSVLRIETTINNPKAFAQFHLRPFRNKDLKAMLLEKGWLEATSITAENTHKITAKTGRIIAKLRAHHLIKKVAKTFQYQLTKQGSQIIKKVLIIRKKHIMAA